MNEVAVVADSRLEEAVVDVVLEVDGFAIRRVLVARTMEVGDSADVLGQDCRQAYGDGVFFERGQGVVADVEVPKRVEDAFAA